VGWNRQHAGFHGDTHMRYTHNNPNAAVLPMLRSLAITPGSRARRITQQPEITEQAPQLVDQRRKLDAAHRGPRPKDDPGRLELGEKQAVSLTEQPSCPVPLNSPTTVATGDDDRHTTVLVERLCGLHHRVTSNGLAPPLTHVPELAKAPQA